MDSKEIIQSLLFDSVYKHFESKRSESLAKIKLLLDLEDLSGDDINNIIPNIIKGIEDLAISERAIDILKSYFSSEK